jgi:colanic acid biosynthesis glycosyl transferase WcaI
MRILLINQFFWPDAAATSQLLTDVAHGLKALGHEVHTISGETGYAITDDSNKPDVQMHRVRSLPFVRGFFGRVASYATFFLSCAWKGLRLPKPDVVVTLTTPPLLSLIGNLLKFTRGSKHYIWEMDMYPDVAADLGMIVPGGLPDRIVGAIADASRARADAILALGECMRDRLTARGVPASKVFIAENWADSNIIQPAPYPDAKEPFTVLYSGNLGLAHDVNTISEVMTRLQSDIRFKFIFAGSGARRASLEALCRDRAINNVEFKSYSAKANLGASLGQGHVGLITQNQSCLGSVVPSKVYGLLAAGRPILFVGPRESTVARVIQRFNCGWQVECGDVAGLQFLLEYLVQNRDKVEAAGARARQALLEHHDRPIGVAHICALLGATPNSPEILNKAGVSRAMYSDGERIANMS